MTCLDGEPDGVAKALDRAKMWEPSISAWSYLAEPGVGASPANAAAGGNLSGVPFAVKDVISVQGMPTCFGSDAFADAEPALHDAPVVGALRQAGAVPLGKTRTTEFAFIDPTVTRNPYDTACSPGGSSSGSGAVVGAGIVPFALGTQTAGSLCRPATYCGAASWKPGLGVLPTAGMAPLSPSFDSIGIIARDVSWIERLFSPLAGAFGIPDTPGWSPGNSALSVGVVVCREQQPDDSMNILMSDVQNRLAGSSHRVDRQEVSFSFNDCIRHHRTIMLAEAAEHLLPMIGDRRHLLKPKFAAGLADGENISGSERDDALGWITNARKEFWSAFGGFDLLLACPVSGGAPKGLTTTGDQSYLTPWTAMGGPLVSLPAGADAAGMPLGVLLAAAPGRDAFLVRTAGQIAPLLPAPPGRPEPAG